MIAFGLSLPGGFMPRISVLMSVYNDALYLRPALDSILQQTHPDFEFVIVDDGSTDATPAILDEYTDSRIVRLRNPQNIGLTLSLNRGLAICQGDYIARMDANDIAIPDRLEHQAAYLDAHPQIGVLSGDIASMDVDGNPLPDEKSPYGIPASHAYLTWVMLWNNPIAHITVMMRRAVLAEHCITYLPEFNRAEDYELWGTLSRVTELVRLSKVYAYRRVVPTGVSFTRRETQLATMYRVAQREVRFLLGDRFPASAIQTFFDSLHCPDDPVGDFRGAADLVVAAYQTYQSKSLSSEDHRRIQGDAVGHLLRLSRRARQYSLGQALYPLWQLRKVSRRDFFSRVMLRHLFAVLPAKLPSSKARGNRA
jgi:glycosyltransferase involved in cell wall biosynthesis